MPDGSYYYDYWIQGSVSSVKKSGLTFKLLLIDTNGNVTDYTKTVTNQITPFVSIGAPLNFGLPQPYTFNSTITFDKVCLDFDGQNLLDYFDYVTLNDGRLCQKFIAEQ